MGEPTDPRPVWRGYQQAELNAQYDQRTLVPDPSPWLDAWREGSKQARRRTAELRVDISYGNRGSERFDLYLPNERPEKSPVCGICARRRLAQSRCGLMRDSRQKRFTVTVPLSSRSGLMQYRRWTWRDR